MARNQVNFCPFCGARTPAPGAPACVACGRELPRARRGLLSRVLGWFGVGGGVGGGESARAVASRAPRENDARALATVLTPLRGAEAQETVERLPDGGTRRVRTRTLDGGMGYVVEEVTSTPVASASRVYDRAEDMPEDVRRALREAGMGDLADAAGNPRASVRVTGMENLRPEDLDAVRRSLCDLPEPMRKLVEDELRRGTRPEGGAPPPTRGRATG